MTGDGTTHAPITGKGHGNMSLDASHISRLANIISAETRKVEEYFHRNGLVLPNFDVDSSDTFHVLPADIARSRKEIIQATQDLNSLMLGPRENVRWMAWDVSRFLRVLKPAA